jgi:hypothetical protein
MTPSIRLATGGAALVLGMMVPSIGMAAEPLPGLWEQTTVTDMSGANMPAMPELSPEVLAQMQAAGIQMPNFSQPQTRTSQYCITPEEIANREPLAEDEEMEENCTQENFQSDENGMSADYICTGENAGTMHMEYVFVSPTHFTGTMTLQGTGQGMAMNMQTNIEGNRLGADCGNVE